MTNPVFFVDDGYSGTNFERPRFQEMLAQIEDGKMANCIIMDLSRLRRNSAMTGLYTTLTFPKYTTRVIAPEAALVVKKIFTTSAWRAVARPKSPISCERIRCAYCLQEAAEP